MSKKKNHEYRGVMHQDKSRTDPVTKAYCDGYNQIDWKRKRRGEYSVRNLRFNLHKEEYEYVN